MKYRNSNNTIFIGDIVKPTRGAVKGKQCIVNKKLVKYNNICVVCIENGIPFKCNIRFFEFVQHCNKEEKAAYYKLCKYLAEQFRNKYRDIDYIKNNWNTDIFMINDFTANTLNRYYEVTCFNPFMMDVYKEEIGNVFLTGSSMKNMLYNMDLIFEL